MFHNRKEQITFRKLKPVQRMAWKHFYESYLTQINTLVHVGVGASALGQHLLETVRAFDQLAMCYDLVHDDVYDGDSPQSTLPPVASTNWALQIVAGGLRLSCERMNRLVLDAVHSGEQIGYFVHRLHLGVRSAVGRINGYVAFEAGTGDERRVARTPGHVKVPLVGGRELVSLPQEATRSKSFGHQVRPRTPRWWMWKVLVGAVA
ncbi:DNA replication factor Cdt1 [Culex quinquefasciatus]|uniref:DNA replication factor Cdt1 n=1 Tax=Culex quinquefasciatus TaxID=7176 RepID=B0X198_CULQU|nr:DNA replication factor Cdt1 [Culex quinquefasciatus]|eukprot:XP_001863420.1 DNA replication factor Cdt1 [Culex quinquefasciatus]